MLQILIPGNPLDEPSRFTAAHSQANHGKRQQRSAQVAKGEAWTILHAFFSAQASEIMFSLVSKTVDPKTLTPQGQGRARQGTAGHGRVVPGEAMRIGAGRGEEELAGAGRAQGGAERISQGATFHLDSRTCLA